MNGTAAQAFWVTGPGRGEIRTESLPALADGHVRIRALYSGVSRGTEALVFNGRVPRSEWQRMRAPFQEGDFPGPVKYGYASVGVVEDGSPAEGTHVFVLHPHQTHYVVPADAVHPIPDAVPAGRAVLAANMETAINAVWDAGPLPGDRLAVIGAGVVGCLVARVAAGIRGCDVELIDLNPQRRVVADALGVSFRSPETATPEADVVCHASGSPEGLQLALRLAAFEATVVELSWYGDRVVALPLGEAFHSRRLTLKSSQVGHVAGARRARWTRARRMELALAMLADPVLDNLITGESRFDELPTVMSRLAAGANGTLCHRIVY